MGYFGPLVLGSIPAPAGEPVSCGRTTSRRRVYPRACGGTVRRCRAGAGGHRVYRACGGYRGGLSPRLRGNPSLRCPPPIRLTGVYPRACGGTKPQDDQTITGRVYPRACGGTGRCRTRLSRAGSIPAPAGEPRASNTVWRLRLRKDIGLSPRLRGNPPPRPFPPRYTGLSPRLRGNRKYRAYSHRHIDRSIPAPAGEPGSRTTRAGPSEGSIPAPAGEPHKTNRSTAAGVGLSPRLRGNHPPPGLSPRLRGNLCKRVG